MLLTFFISDYYYIRNKKGPKSLNVLPPDEHAQRRRLWNRGMSSDSLSEYEVMIARRAMQLMDKLSKEGGPINIISWLNYFSCVENIYVNIRCDGIDYFILSIKRFDFVGDMACVYSVFRMLQTL